MNKFIIIPTALFLSGIFNTALAAINDEGYYATARIAKVWQKAHNMDTTSRPGVGQFVSGDEKDDFYNGSIAAGYQYGNGWRTEVEYTFKNKSEYTSGSSRFTTSLNHHKVNTQRVMLNAYRDYNVYENIFVYGTAGLGIAKNESSGWQNRPGNTFDSNTDTNLVYSLGAGISYEPINKLNLDLGYRYVDLGKIESGYNNFTNVRGLKDEQMKAHLKSHEINLGIRYTF
ncbi:outer membrane protein [Actinomadura verrucosospora]